MSIFPIGVGDIEAQKRFIERNRTFLEEFPKLFALYSRVFIRSLAPPSESERQAFLHLPDDDPAVIAFEDKIMADRVVFYLGRMAADDFGEICTLSGNGRGFGSYKIVRGMYERVVTAMYIAGKPSESRAFVESSSITKLNYLTRLLRAVPEMKGRYDDEFMQRIKSDAAAAQVTCLDFLIHVELRISAFRQTLWACDSPDYCVVARRYTPSANARSFPWHRPGYETSWRSNIRRASFR